MTSPADVHAAKLATIDAADDAPEALRERVARAIWTEACRDAGHGPLWEDAGDIFVKPMYRRLADAAIATIATPVEGAPAGCGAEAALRRVLALADELDGYYPDPDSEWDLSRAEAFTAAADRIREAAGEPA